MHKPTTIYRNNGDTFEYTYFIDAREAVTNHPEEWSFTPFSADVITATQRAALERALVEVDGKSDIDLHNARLIGVESVNGKSIT